MIFKKEAKKLDLGFDHRIEDDRNLDKGGRSFYFFDFDDNVAYLTTPIILFKKGTDEEKAVSSGEFAHHHKDIGERGKYKDYYMNFDDAVGSFRCFRDEKLSFFEKLIGKKQGFITDVKKAIHRPEYDWKAPSWPYFYYATLNQRPMSLITARGHHPETIKEGIRLMIKEGHLPCEPNYLSIFPVNDRETRRILSDPEIKERVPELKKRAIRMSVEMAIKVYGNNPHHRFGMSDDDPKNIELITEEMVALKRDFPLMSFFVIQTKDHQCLKKEILLDSFKEETIENESTTQLPMFDA